MRVFTVIWRPLLYLEKRMLPIFFVIMTESNAVLNYFLKFLCQIATLVGENNVSSVAVNKYEFASIGWELLAFCFYFVTYTLFSGVGMDVKLARKKMYILLAEDWNGEGDGQKDPNFISNWNNHLIYLKI